MGDSEPYDPNNYYLYNAFGSNDWFSKAKVDIAQKVIQIIYTFIYNNKGNK